MFENELLTRCAIGGTGILLGLVFVLAALPLLLLVIPVALIFLGLVADPEETHAVWYGMLNVLGIFDLTLLTDEEKANYAVKRHYFWFGEVALAAVLAGIWLAGRSGISLAVTGAAVLFLPLFVFLPKLIRYGMKADAGTAIEAFGKNGQVKKVFWAVFVAMAGVLLAQVVEPGTAREILAILAGGIT